MEITKVDKILNMAFEEDMPMGDITTDSTIPPNAISEAALIAKDTGVLAGLAVFERAFLLQDKDIEVKKYFNDGDEVKNGDKIALIKGKTRGMLKAERTALNLLQRMSGIATKTNGLVKLVEGTNAKVVDTRKTTPGIRYLEKYAVRVGGGSNHRYCLSDGVMIKDNHIKACGSIKDAVANARKNIPHTIKIEVETENLDMVKEAVVAGADIIMLDNMTCDEMKTAINFIDGRAITEASGNVTKERIREIALTGINIISVGGITHSVKAMDISLKM